MQQQASYAFYRHIIAIPRSNSNGFRARPERAPRLPLIPRRWLLLAIAAVVWAPALALAGTLLTLQYTDPKTNSNFDDHAEHENTPFVSGNKVLKAWLFHEKKGICTGDSRCKTVPMEEFPDVTFEIKTWDADQEVVA